MSGRGECKACGREFTLTRNGRVRSHKDNGVACPGSSDLPKYVGSPEPPGRLPNETTGHFRARVAEFASEHPDHDPRPTTEEVRNADKVLSSDAPDGVAAHAEDILNRADYYGTRSEKTDLGGPNPWRAPLSDHTHRYEYADDDAGHSGSFCAVCDEPEPVRPSMSELTRQVIEVLNRRTPEQKAETAARMDARASHLLGLPHDRQTEEPCPTVSSLPTSDPESGSRLSSPASAPAAETSSRSATPSGPTDQETTKGSAVAVTEVDAFLSPSKPDPIEPRWKRYRLPRPATGKMQTWTRATTFNGTIADTYHLDLWQRRMLAKGLSLRPDLVALAATLDVKGDKDRLNKLAEQAQEFAGDRVAANLGSVVHKYTEHVDNGGDLDSVPEPHRRDVHAYRTALESAGLSLVPHLVERITAVTAFGVAGKFDRVYRLSDGTYVIGDVKTGKSLDLAAMEIGVQLAVYAHGINESGVYDVDAERWLSPGGPWQIPTVRTDFGIIMHVPAGSGVCTVYRIDLVQGWTDAQLCAEVRRTRKLRGRLAPYVPSAESLEADPPTWEDRFSSVDSRSAASALYREALTVFGSPSGELQRLVDIAKVRLSDLGL